LGGQAGSGRAAQLADRADQCHNGLGLGETCHRMLRFTSCMADVQSMKFR
jgi:hypothetical protein